MSGPARTVLLLAAGLAVALGLPIVDSGLFVIMDVRTCREGQGYCLLGLDCTMDEDFLPDDQGGHCDGLRSAFTPSAHFICCRYNPRGGVDATTGQPDTTTTTTTVNTVNASLALEPRRTTDPSPPRQELGGTADPIAVLYTQQLHTPRDGCLYGHHADTLDGSPSQAPGADIDLSRTDADQGTATHTMWPHPGAPAEDQDFPATRAVHGDTHLGHTERGNELFPPDETLRRENPMRDAQIESITLATDEVARVSKHVVSRAVLPRDLTTASAPDESDSNEIQGSEGTRSKYVENEINTATSPSTQNYFTTPNTPLLNKSMVSTEYSKIKNSTIINDPNEISNIITEDADNPHNYTTTVKDKFTEENETETSSFVNGETALSEHWSSPSPFRTTNTIPYVTSRNENDVTTLNEEVIPTKETFQMTEANVSLFEETEVTTDSIPSSVGQMTGEHTPTTQRTQENVATLGVQNTSETPLMTHTEGAATSSDAPLGGATPGPWRCRGHQHNQCWMVVFVDSRDGKTLCCGTFLSADTVLTSAKCVIRLFTNGLQQVQLKGDAARLSSAKLRDVLVHEDYDIEGPMAVLNDLGMVRLNTGAFLDPECSLCLPQVEEDFMGQQCCSTANTSLSGLAGRPADTNMYTHCDTGEGARPSQHSRSSTEVQADDEMAGSALLCGSVLAGVASVTQAGAIFTPTTDHLSWIHANMA